MKTPPNGFSSRPESAPRGSFRQAAEGSTKPRRSQQSGPGTLAESVLVGGCCCGGCVVVALSSFGCDRSRSPSQLFIICSKLAHVFLDAIHASHLLKQLMKQLQRHQVYHWIHCSPTLIPFPSQQIRSADRSRREAWKRFQGARASKPCGWGGPAGADGEVRPDVADGAAGGLLVQLGVPNTGNTGNTLNAPPFSNGGGEPGAF